VVKISKEFRNKEIIRLYADGQTLQEVGDRFGLTRERVRQILRQFSTLTWQDGGANLRLRRAKEKREKDRERYHLKKNGCTYEQYKSLLDIGSKMVADGYGQERTPLRAFARQRENAHKRGVEFKFKLWEWWSVWRDSGKWEDRGLQVGQYVMCRIGDVGAYEPSNVFIDTSINNVSLRSNRKTDLPTGVRHEGKRFVAREMVDGKLREIGRFDSATLAGEAYRASLDARILARKSVDTGKHAN
jgi:hypothetical protein